MIYTAQYENFFFASLDGELFLGVDRMPAPEDEPEIVKMFDARGWAGTLPMRVHRRLLESYGATFGTVGDPPHTLPQTGFQKSL